MLGTIALITAIISAIVLAYNIGSAAGYTKALRQVAQKQLNLMNPPKK